MSNVLPNMQSLEPLPVISGEHIQPVTNDAIDADKVIEQLACLPILQYEQIRKEEAKKLGIKVSTLDSYVKNARNINNDDEGDSIFTKVEPWPESIDPEELLLEITGTIRRFIVCESETALAATLWIAMTWFIDEIQVAPLAIITAPEKRCGKSELLSIFGKMCYRPLPSSNISPAALFRSIDKYQPTLLIDEADAFMKENEDLRGLLNAGHTRESAYCLRCVGENHEPKKFHIWGAKALSGIGKLADTLMDRSIVLELRRKRPDEKIERRRHAPEGLFETLQRKLARFAEDYRVAINAARPDIPEVLNDRAQDNWEPLLAIADTAGNEYGCLAREAAVKLSAGGDEVLSLGVELLVDIFEVFEERDVDRIFSDELIKALCADKEKRWATYNYRSNNPRITPKQLSALLKNYDIKSRDVRGCIDTKTLSGNPLAVKKGYYLSQFKDAFQRYLPFLSTPPEIDATPATESHIIPKVNNGEVLRVSGIDGGT